MCITKGRFWFCVYWSVSALVWDMVIFKNGWIQFNEIDLQVIEIIQKKNDYA